MATPRPETTKTVLGEGDGSHTSMGLSRGASRPAILSLTAILILIAMVTTAAAPESAGPEATCTCPGTVNVSTLTCSYHEDAVMDGGNVPYGRTTCGPDICPVYTAHLGYERELCHPRDGPMPAIGITNIRIRSHRIPEGGMVGRVTFKVIHSPYLQSAENANKGCDHCRATVSYRNIIKSCTHLVDGLFSCDVPGPVTTVQRPVVTIIAMDPLCHHCTKADAPHLCDYEGSPSPETGTCMLHIDAHVQTAFSLERFVELEVRKMTGTADIVGDSMKAYVGERFVLGARVTNYWTIPVNVVLILDRKGIWSTFQERSFPLLPGETRTVPIELFPYTRVPDARISLSVEEAGIRSLLDESSFHVQVIHPGGSSFMTHAPGVGPVDTALLFVFASLFLVHRSARPFTRKGCGTK